MLKQQIRALEVGESPVSSADVALSFNDMCPLCGTGSCTCFFWDVCDICYF